MRWSDDLDPYDDAAQQEAEADAAIDLVLRDYDAARDALRSITPLMDRTQRWAILDRYAAAVLAMEVEMDRAHYGETNDRIVAEIRGAA
jgi:hypothetical protein